MQLDLAGDDGAEAGQRGEIEHVRSGHDSVIDREPLPRVPNPSDGYSSFRNLA